MLIPQSKAPVLWETQDLLGVCSRRGLVPVPDVWHQGKETCNLCLFATEKPKLVPW